MTQAPELEGEDGWGSLDGFRSNRRSFVRTDLDDDRLRVRYFRREADGALVGKIWFGPGTQGPPGHAHGGSMASVLDDAMGISAWLAGHMVVAAEIRIRFLNMLPLGTVAWIEACAPEVDGKKVKTVGKLHAPDGTVYATGEGLFIHLGPERFSEFAERARRQQDG